MKLNHFQNASKFIETLRSEGAQTGWRDVVEKELGTFRRGIRRVERDRESRGRDRGRLDEDRFDVRDEVSALREEGDAVLKVTPICWSVRSSQDLGNATREHAGENLR